MTAGGVSGKGASGGGNGINQWRQTKKNGDSAATKYMQHQRGVAAARVNPA